MKNPAPAATAGDVHSRALPTAGVPRLVEGFSIEAAPRQLAGGGLTGLLPARTSIYVPFLPRADLAETVTACRHVLEQGYRPVPHLAARALPNRARLESHLGALADAGVDSMLLIAGDRVAPLGPFANTLDLLDTGLLERYGFHRLGVAGHPEGHPDAGSDQLYAALRRKMLYAGETGCTMWIVSQFAFSAGPILHWLDDLRTHGVDLPVRIGLAGPAGAQTLLRYAAQCGVGASSRMLVRRPRAMTRLLGRWTPQDLLVKLAREMDKRDRELDGVHVFPFGGLERSIAYFRALREGA